MHSAQSTESLASVVLTTPTPANSGDSGHSSQISGDGGGGGGAAASANSSAAYQPRLHPKKRKFNPADLESMDITMNDNKVTVFERTSSVDDKNGPVVDGGSRSGGTSNDAPQDTRSDVATGHSMSTSTSTAVIKEENGSQLKAIMHYGQNSHYDGRRAGSATDLIESQHKMFTYSKGHRASNHARDESGGGVMQHERGALAQPTTSSTVREYQAPQPQPDDIDLNEWCNHRVLAKHQDVYVTGVIRSVGPANAVLVELDHPEGSRQMYYDILANGRYDVVSDASPSVNDVSNLDLTWLEENNNDIELNRFEINPFLSYSFFQITLGCRVCIQVQLPNRPGSVFVEGAVTQIHNDTKSYSVLLLNGTGNSDIRNVKRGQIRLLRPPWWDELNDEPEAIAPTYAPSNNKRPYYSSGRGSGQSTAIMYSNNAVPPSSNRNHSVVEVGGNRLKYSPRVDATGAALQLHHVLPTIQVRNPPR